MKSHHMIQIPQPCVKFHSFDARLRTLSLVNASTLGATSSGVAAAATASRDSRTVDVMAGTCGASWSGRLLVSFKLLVSRKLLARYSQNTHPSKKNMPVWDFIQLGNAHFECKYSTFHYNSISEPGVLDKV